MQVVCTLRGVQCFYTFGFGCVVFFKIVVKVAQVSTTAAAAGSVVDNLIDLGGLPSSGAGAASSKPPVDIRKQHVAIGKVMFAFNQFTICILLSSSYNSLPSDATPLDDNGPLPALSSLSSSPAALCCHHLIDIYIAHLTA